MYNLGIIDGMAKDKTIILIAVVSVVAGILLGVILFKGGTPGTNAPDVQDFSPTQTPGYAPNLSEGGGTVEALPELKPTESSSASGTEASETTAPGGR